MIPLAIIGCAIFAGLILAKAHSPSSDEPSDQYSDPFGDVVHAPDALVIHRDEWGDFCGLVHEHEEGQ